MKTALALLALLACASPAFATDISLSTTDGKTYTHITSLRADPDGVYIEYSTPGGGIGGKKVKFSKLSPDLQKQYGYNADAARKFEDDNAKATLTFQTWASQQDEARQKAIAEREARELQEETLATQRTIAAAQTAPATPSAPPGEPYYSPDWSYGFGGAGIGRLAPRNAFTGETYQGMVPEGTLFTPLGFSPNKRQFIPATPQSQNRFRDNSPFHQQSPRRF